MAVRYARHVSSDIFSTTADQPINPRSLGFAEDYVQVSDDLREARNAAISAGAPAISTGAATFLTFLAKTVNAKAVVEVGTGTGAAGLALFAGMADDGVLTSIDSEADLQQSAREAFTVAGIPAPRYRLIAGVALDVLNNLRDGAYDLMFINGDKLEYVEYVAAAQRLLRPGGLVVLNDALWHNLVADLNDESDETLIIREALAAINSPDTAFTPALIPLGDGLAVGVKNP